MTQENKTINFNKENLSKLKDLAIRSEYRIYHNYLDTIEEIELLYENEEIILQENKQELIAWFNLLQYRQERLEIYIAKMRKKFLQLKE